MPKIFCALFEGAPVRYIYIKSKKEARRPWFFHEDVSKALGVVFRTEHIPDRLRMELRLSIAAAQKDISLLSLEGIFFLTVECDLAHAARFLAFLAACGIGGAA